MKQARFMREWISTLDDGGILQIHCPLELTESELEDVKSLAALWIRQLERCVIKPDLATAPASGDKEPQ